MPIPPIGYFAEVHGCPKQTLPRSDWPVAAGVAALASGKYFGPLGSNAEASLRAWLVSQDIPESRIDHWLLALRGQHALIPGDASTSARFNPHDHQNYAASAMSCAGGVLNLGCGLGKTLTAEIYANAVAPRLRGKPLVLASNLTALDGGAWDPYIPRFKKLGFSDVFKVSIDSLHKFEPGFRSDGGLLILDEGHLLGGSSARRTKHAMRLRLKMDDALVLTGTLFHGGILRAITAMNLAIPGLGAFSSGYMAAHYFGCIKPKRVGDKTYQEIIKPQGADFERFKEFVTKRYVVSLTKKADIVRKCVNIPDQTIESVHLDGPWESVHFAAVQEVKRAIAAGEGIPHAKAVYHTLARSGIQSKIDWLLDALCDGEPCAVFAYYKESLDAIQAALTESGISFVRVDGDVTGDDRRAAIGTFQSGGTQVFLGQTEAAGISVELTRACRSVCFEPGRRGDAYDQMLARTCRPGQLRPCVHTDLVATRLQERIVEVVRSGGIFDASIAEYQDVRRATGEHDATT